MNRWKRSSHPASPSCAARAAVACFRAAYGPASEVPNGAVAVHAVPASRARREVAS
jgi:hypothetical protein